MDLLLGFTQIGWYAWGTATMALLLVKMTGLPDSMTLPLMVVCSAAVVTAHLLGGSPIYSLLLERRLRLDATA